MSSQAAGHAWLIGASSGMGFELARQLVDSGWQVTISARDVEALQQAADDIQAAAQPLDITDRGAVEACADRLFGVRAPQLVVINAGDYQPMALEHYDVELFERLNRVNYLGAVYVLGAILPRMRDSGGGQVLINASSAGYRGLPYAAPYSAPKAAAIHLAEALRPEARRWGITLRVINPGSVRSRLTARNRFRMPGLMDPDRAARRIAAAISRDGFEISFPRRLIWPLKCCAAFPIGSSSGSSNVR